jgi:RNA polymerase sigma-70 factor (ECF subfamily)
VLQDTLLAVARGVRAFRGESSLSTWLYTIARSFCIKRRRTASASEQVLDETPDPAKHPDEALAGKEVERALEQAIAALEPMYREVLLLRDVEGLSATEVAAVLGLSSAAVKSRLHRARLAVRAQVAPLLGVPEIQPGCPDVLTLFSRHLEGEISAPVCADMERHLASCARCRGACDSLKRTLALCQRAAPAVPAAVQARVKVALRDFLDEKS